MKEENEICGKTLPEIRKAYFKGKLNQLIAEMQSEGTLKDVNGAKALKVFLGTLKEEGEKVRKEMSDGFADEMGMEDDIQPPSVDDLAGKDVNFDKWLTEKEDVLTQVRAKMVTMRKGLASSNFDIKQLQDLAFELSFWRNWIVQDTVYKRQLWKKKLTRLIDDFKISRKEAEDRSELTPEYRDYVLASEFQRIVEDLIISARKGYAE